MWCIRGYLDIVMDRWRVDIVLYGSRNKSLLRTVVFPVFLLDRDITVATRIKKIGVRAIVNNINNDDRKNE